MGIDETSPSVPKPLRSRALRAGVRGRASDGPAGSPVRGMWQHLWYVSTQARSDCCIGLLEGITAACGMKIANIRAAPR
jgi:hypothetical protein